MFLFLSGPCFFFFCRKLTECVKKGFPAKKGKRKSGNGHETVFSLFSGIYGRNNFDATPKRELGNEIRQGRKYIRYSKVKTNVGLSSFSGNTGPLTTKKTEPLSSLLMGLPSFISQLTGAASRKDASSQDRVSPHCRTLGDQTLHTRFESSSSSTRLTMAPKKTSLFQEKTEPKKGVKLLVGICIRRKY